MNSSAARDDAFLSQGCALIGWRRPRGRAAAGSVPAILVILAVVSGAFGWTAARKSEMARAAAAVRALAVVELEGTKATPASLVAEKLALGRLYMRASRKHADAGERRAASEAVTKAVAILEEAARLEGGSGTAARELALAYLHAAEQHLFGKARFDSYEGARVILERLTEAAPNDVEIAWELTRTLASLAELRNGRSGSEYRQLIEAAQARLERAVRLDLAFAEINLKAAGVSLWIGELQYGLEQYAAAIVNLRRALPALERDAAEDLQDFWAVITLAEAHALIGESLLKGEASKDGEESMFRAHALISRLWRMPRGNTMEFHRMYYLWSWVEVRLQGLALP